MAWEAASRQSSLHSPATRGICDAPPWCWRLSFYVSPSSWGGPCCHCVARMLSSKERGGFSFDNVLRNNHLEAQYVLSRKCGSRGLVGRGRCLLSVSLLLVRWLLRSRLLFFPSIGPLIPSRPPLTATLPFWGLAACLTLVNGFSLSSSFATRCLPVVWVSLWP